MSEKEIKTSSMDVEKLVKCMESGKFSRDIPWQRSDGLYDAYQRSLLIDTTMRGFKIPSIWITKTATENFDKNSIIDGIQRTTTLYKYISVIEKPTYRANQKYSDWLARQNGVSWKTRLCDEIDNLVLREDVRTVEDLAERLREKYYAVTLKKYLSIKVSENRKAIRSYRLGDGYAIEELQYRIENKNHEMSLQAVAKFQGIQREYALCLRELQIMVYRKTDNSHKTTYRELRQNADLLTFLCNNNIHSVTDFENVVNALAEKSDSLKKSRDKILREIVEKEAILQDGAKYIELNKIKMPTAVQLEELAGLKHLSKVGLRSEDDIQVHGLELEKLKSEVSEIGKNIEIAEKEKSEVASNYKIYLRQMQSDYDFILEKMRREREKIEQAEREFQHTKVSENRQRNYFEC